MIVLNWGLFSPLEPDCLVLAKKKNEVGFFSPRIIRKVHCYQDAIMKTNPSFFLCNILVQKLSFYLFSLCIILPLKFVLKVTWSLHAGDVIIDALNGVLLVPWCTMRCVLTFMWLAHQSILGRQRKMHLMATNYQDWSSRSSDLANLWWSIKCGFG